MSIMTRSYSKIKSIAINGKISFRVVKRTIVMSPSSFINFVTFVLACVSAHRLGTTSRVVGGTEADQVQFPHQV